MVWMEGAEVGGGGTSRASVWRSFVPPAARSLEPPAARPPQSPAARPPEPLAVGQLNLLFLSSEPLLLGHLKPPPARPLEPPAAKSPEGHLKLRLLI
jgi:hypothetical protein